MFGIKQIPTQSQQDRAEEYTKALIEQNKENAGVRWKSISEFMVQVIMECERIGFHRAKLRERAGVAFKTKKTESWRYAKKNPSRKILRATHELHRPLVPCVGASGDEAEQLSLL
jgi:prolyl-tRNA synthetase